MKKKDILMWILTILITIALLLIVSKWIFSDKNGLNEGKFRVTDAIVTSSASVEDVDSDQTKWNINISQINNLAILIQGMDGEQVSKITIDKMKVLKRPKYGDIYIYEPKTKELINVRKKVGYELPIYVQKGDNQTNTIELDIINKNIVKNYIVPDNIKQIRHDGTVLALIGKNIKEISFKVCFRILVYSVQGEKYTSTVTLNLPDNTLTSNGIVITRLDLTEFKFKM